MLMSIARCRCGKTYRFVQATPEDVAAVWRACEIRDAGLRRLRERGV
jgi:hypothetical protein